MYLTRSKAHGFILYGLFAFFLIVFAQWVNAEQVRTDKVKSWNKGEQVSLHCEVVVPYKNQISSYVDAELLWALPAGSKVKEGDVLAKQDNFQLDRKRKILDIRIANAKSKVTFTHKEYTRLKALNSEHVSESQLNGVRRQHEEASYKLAEMEQQREVINYQFRRLEHRAPIAGQVINVTANLGENMSVGQPILQLIPTKFKELACRMPLDVFHISKVEESEGLSSFHFKLKDNESLTLTRHEASANKAEQSITVFLSLPTSRQAVLVVGKRLRVTMYHKKKNITQIPFDAMVLDTDGNFVWTLDEENKVNKQPVFIVAALAQNFIVRSKLTVDTRVVVRGKQSLEPGKEVSVEGMYDEFSK